MTALTFGGQQQAGNITYNTFSQATSIKVGPTGTYQATETYSYDSQTGLLTNQKVQQNGQTLLDLSYDYQRLNSSGSTTSGKTGNLTKITNNLNSNKNREYEYDALGRLRKATGGTNLWWQAYSYDRYGNKTGVSKSGNAADGSAIPLDGAASLSYNAANNRITTSGYYYDVAGNQTRALAPDGVTWLNFEYDSANRLRIVKRDNGTALEAYQYGATNARLMNYSYATNLLTLYASIGGKVLAEYPDFTSAVPTWTKSYTYLGSRLLSTIYNSGGTEVTEYSHPDRLGTRLITRQSAGTNFEQTTLPFGTYLAGESTGATAQLFTSYDRSGQTGLDYAINRTYDSRQGRFTQVDPIGMAAASIGNPQSLNMDAYVQNNPIDFVDPSGLNQEAPILRIETWTYSNDSFARFIWFVLFGSGGGGGRGGETGGIGGGGGSPRTDKKEGETCKDLVSNLVNAFYNSVGVMTSRKRYS